MTLASFLNIIINRLEEILEDKSEHVTKEVRSFVDGILEQFYSLQSAKLNVTDDDADEAWQRKFNYFYRAVYKRDKPLQKGFKALTDLANQIADYTKIKKESKTMSRSRLGKILTEEEVQLELPTSQKITNKNYDLLVADTVKQMFKKIDNDEYYDDIFDAMSAMFWKILEEDEDGIYKWINDIDDEDIKSDIAMEVFAEFWGRIMKNTTR